jgi:N-acetylglucosaminyl-diphospho-decaprenol L-rhamnosyltransferase
MLLSILIVNYNGLRFLRACLESVEKHVACDHEVIVVDNASVDGSVAFLREHFPQVRLIASETNTGFTGGNNIAAAAARGELLLLLNNDTVVLSPIQPALDALAPPRVGIVGVHLQYADGANQASAGYAHTPARLLLSWLGLSGLRFLPDVFRRVETREQFYRADKSGLDWVSGAFLLTRRALWERVGGLDERYFMYVEDVDYCHRVKQEGYSIDYVAKVDVLHYEGAGKLWIGETALLRTMNSYSLFLRKYHSAPVARLTQAALGLVMGGRALAYLLRSLSSTSAVVGEKKQAYFKAARYLLSAG